jgi:hypothetical protein
MKKKQFDEEVRGHLSKYNKGKDGWYRNKGGYKHILYLPEECKTDKELFIKKQKEVVFNFGLITPAKINPFFLDGHLHPLAHHLTSSQIMCYNFFRPLINKKGIPTPKLIELFKFICPDLEWDESSIARFEYQEEGEGTNFDFILHTNSIKIYCEIKYTEKDFTKQCKTKTKNHFKKQYSGMIAECSHLWKEKVKEDDFMKQYFQLFRNVIRARTDNDYVLFICPKDRDDLEESFDSFKKFYLKDDIQNIQYIYWESLIENAKKIGVDVSEFEGRYFMYK